MLPARRLMARADGSDLRIALGELSRRAQRDLVGALGRARTVDGARAIMAELMPALIDKYAAAAATAAADWYDEVRDQAEVRGGYRASVPDVGAPGVQSLLGWAADQAVDLTTFRTLALGGYTRRILKYGRSTVTRNAVADPGADGWMRQGRGDNCDFCNMLIGRGAVYGEKSVEFASHDHCSCVAVVAFKGHEKPVLLRADGTRATVSRRGDRTDAEQRRVSNERVRSWIESHPNAG